MEAAAHEDVIDPCDTKILTTGRPFSPPRHQLEVPHVSYATVLERLYEATADSAYGSQAHDQVCVYQCLITSAL
jgi:hypothetical protein